MVSKKSERINIRISPDLKLVAENAAKGECRSLTSLIEFTLSKYLIEKGYLPAKETKK